MSESVNEIIGYPSIDKPWLKYYSEEAIQAAKNPMKCSMYQYIYETNKDNPEEIAIEYMGANITYAEMFTKIDMLAENFFEYGIKAGDFVTLCLPNIPEYIYIVYAINKIGAAVNLIDPRSNSERILEQTNSVNSRLLFVIRDICNERINLIADKICAEKIIVISAADSAKSIFVRLKYLKRYNCCFSNKYTLYREFIGQSAKRKCMSSIYTENTTAAVVYTSGTTGVAKGVMLSNEGIIAAARQLCITLNLAVSKRFLGIIPFSFAYGLVDGMHTALSNHMTLTLIPKYNPNKFTNLVVKYKPNVVIAVPKFWEDMAYKLQGKKRNLSYLIYPISGGDKISDTSVRFINSCFVQHKASAKLLIGYGASEFGAAVSLTTPEGPYESGSSGELLPIGNIKIIDRESGEELPYDTDGEICIQTQSMMLGYYGHEEETVNITCLDQNKTKFYRTGDKGHISKQGSIYIVDRYKRVMMRPDGHTVHATSIENVLMSTEELRACAVVGLKLSGRAGVIPTAFIVPIKDNENIENLVKRLDRYSLCKLPDRDRALAYVLLNTIPYTMNGKIDYGELENQSIDDVAAFITDSTFIDNKKGKVFL